ncbi:MAG TPA: helix-turn-helix domain-containing protein [Tissierellaceae bacterium]|nr:helix-turn-helix domain-containing protein [Tissierellaceae bacterium]
MVKINVEGLAKLFNDTDILLITDKEGYIKYYNIINNLEGNRINEYPVGMHILDLHQHLDSETSTIMRVLKNNEVVINEKQHLNIYKEKTVTVLATTLPLISNGQIVGAIEINRYFDKDLIDFEKDGFKYNQIKDHFFFTIDDLIVEYNKKMEKNVKGLSKEVFDLFMKYHWPGNVREIKHIIESAFNFIEGDDIIELEHLPHHFIYSKKDQSDIISINDDHDFDLNEVIKNSEIKYIRLALESSKTLSEAAKVLKISRQSLKYKIDTYGIKLY